MRREWIHEEAPVWDGPKERIVGGAPPGVFSNVRRGPGELLAGDWWRVEEDGETVGYGWMDVVWGDGEILLAVEGGHQRKGLGAFILEHLEREAGSRGLNYIYNTVRETHPDRTTVARWLEARGFRYTGEGERLSRRVAR